ncbi:stomatin-like protein 1 isoform X1 [Falco biarmicus]|uniref:stomatin-like protein 1 isoform X1 n=1 Tax=Falco cherrug TaxID=345164 RepID=UPI000FFB0A4B|nr:stomatin-like protein 1 isoform X1 [Falco cherrug]XP_037250245.1 stomatin-like protein 1 isoform X1 [Falco rusticolus]XP_056201959.1 stomatin-like protein 1 isoform X1 [Falco biarmicus]
MQGTSTMFSRSGYQALPLGDFDRFQQSSIGLYGAQKGFFSFGSKEDSLGPARNTTDTSQGWLSWICHGIITSLVFLLMVVTFPISGWFALKIVPTYERMIIFRLGRIRAPQGPGVVLLLPFIDHWQRVDLRTRAFNVPPCKLTSKDGAVISMGADVQFRVWDPVLSVMMVKDLIAATRMMAQNAMTKTLVKKSLREIQVEKLRIGEQLLLEINNMTKSWGLEVDRVELSMEAVLQPPRENLVGPLATMPPVPGLEGLDGTIQQLAAHLFSSTLALAGSGTNAPEADSVETVNEVEPPTAPLLTTPSSAWRKPSADELFSAVEPVLSEALVNQVGASYQVNIILPSGAQSTYFIDLSSGSGWAGRSMPEGSPDVILEVAEKDLQDLFLGDLRPLSAYMSGRLQVKGDLHLALKLEELVKAMKQRR